MDGKGTLLIVICAALLTWPGAADAGAPQTYEYTTATNVRAPGLTLTEGVICPDDCTIGGFVFAHPRADATVVAADVAWGENVGALYCTRTLGGSWCGEDPHLDVVPDREYSHGPVCGPTVVPLQPHALAPEAIAYVYTALVLDDLTFCGASSGSMTITH